MRERSLQEAIGQNTARPQPDPTWRALDALADRWSFLVLREAFFGVRRYGVFQRNLGIARNVLASRLSTLVEQGLLRRVRYRTDPDWYEYRLTPASLELFPALLALKAWSERHLVDAEDSAMLEIHLHVCGEMLRPVVVCACCGQPLRVTDVQYDVVANSHRMDAAKSRPTSPGGVDTTNRPGKKLDQPATLAAGVGSWHRYCAGNPGHP